tara:strand:+ start:708 stop:1877 length:1170 start_codon:yes stop_codon:yes gene_type:complete
MPFKSKKQETFLKINYPKIARKWAKKSKKFNLSALGLEKYEKKKNQMVEGKSLSHEGIEGGPSRSTLVKNPPKTYRGAPTHQLMATYRPPLKKMGKKAVYKKMIEKKSNKPPLYKADDAYRRDLKSRHMTRPTVSTKNNQTTRTRTLTKNGKNVDRNANLTGRRVHGPNTYEDGVTGIKKMYEVSTPEGLRWYKGEGESRSSSLAQRKAEFDAEAKANLNPQDSVITGGKIPVFSKPPKKEKGKPKKRFWALPKKKKVSKKNNKTKVKVGGVHQEGNPYKKMEVNPKVMTVLDVVKELKGDGGAIYDARQKKARELALKDLPKKRVDWHIPSEYQRKARKLVKPPFPQDKEDAQWTADHALNEKKPLYIKKRNKWEKKRDKLKKKMGRN